jgi:hypothetical protein
MVPATHSALGASVEDLAETFAESWTELFDAGHTAFVAQLEGPGPDASPEVLQDHRGRRAVTLSAVARATEILRGEYGTVVVIGPCPGGWAVQRLDEVPA